MPPSSALTTYVFEEAPLYMMLTAPPDQRPDTNAFLGLGTGLLSSSVVAATGAGDGRWPSKIARVAFRATPATQTHTPRTSTWAAVFLNQPYYVMITSPTTGLRTSLHYSHDSGGFTWKKSVLGGAPCAVVPQLLSDPMSQRELQYGDQIQLVLYGSTATPTGVTIDGASMARYIRADANADYRRRLQGASAASPIEPNDSHVVALQCDTRRPHRDGSFLCGNNSSGGGDGGGKVSNNRVSRTAFIVLNGDESGVCTASSYVKDVPTNNYVTPSPASFAQYEPVATCYQASISLRDVPRANDSGGVSSAAVVAGESGDSSDDSDADADATAAAVTGAGANQQRRPFRRHHRRRHRHRFHQDQLLSCSMFDGMSTSAACTRVVAERWTMFFATMAVALLVLVFLPWTRQTNVLRSTLAFALVVGVWGVVAYGVRTSTDADQLVATIGVVVGSVIVGAVYVTMRQIYL